MEVDNNEKENDNGNVEPTAIERLQELQDIWLAGPSIDHGALSIETLIDLLINVYQDCKSSNIRHDKSLTDFLERARPVVERAKELRLSKNDFEVLKVIGKGAFGEVTMVRMIGVGGVYAMKTMNKRDILNRAETVRFREERELLIHGDKNLFTQLHFAFQDDINLYFVMTFYPGGDLLTTLTKLETMNEETAAFYFMELVLAVDAVHRLGYIHRDIKPDNVMIERTGHIRLGDFGGCLKLEPDGLCPAGQTAVGTPDYISPEILNANGTNKRYGREVDYWSCGILLYELFYGETPFYSEELATTYAKIMSHQDLLDFPDRPLSEDALDLVRQLVCSAENRLGKNGVEDFRNIPFLTRWKFNFDNILSMTGDDVPYIPTVTNPWDTSNFFMEYNSRSASPVINDPPRLTSSNFSGKNLAFVGFTYTEGSLLSEKQSVIADNSGAPIYQKRMKALEEEKAALETELLNLVTSFGMNNEDEDNPTAAQIIAQLREENSILRNRLSDSTTSTLRTPKREQAGEDVEEKLREYKEEIKRLRAEKAEVQRINEDISERLDDLSAERDNATKQFERAKSEIEEISNEISAEKIRSKKAESELAEKVEEVNKLEEKLRQQRATLRTIEDEKLELDELASKLKSDLEMERTANVGLNAQLTALGSKAESDDSRRLAEELERLNERHTEVIAQEEAKRKQLVENYQKQLDEMRTSVEEKDREMRAQRAKFDEQRAEWLSSHEQELKSIETENQRVLSNLRSNMASLTVDNAELKSRSSALEEELYKLRHTTITHDQLEIVMKGINEMKENRQMTEELAKKINEDFALVKEGGAKPHDNGSNIIESSVGWGRQRNKRVAQIGGLDAQQQLQAEVKAKLQLKEEFNKQTTDLLNTRGHLENALRQINALQLENDELRALRSGKSDGNVSLPRRHFFNVVGGATAVGEQDNSFNHSFPNAASISGHDLSDRLPDVISHKSSSDHLLNTERSPLKPDLHNQPVLAAGDSYSVGTTRSEECVPAYENTHTVGSSSSTMSAGHVRTAHSKAVKSLNNALSGIGHKFEHVTLTKPTKCIQCTSILIGLDRQGLHCQRCECVSHVYCQPAVPAVCPVPNDARRPLGIDPRKGVGTAYEGVVKVPKPGGVKKGWLTCLVAVVDYKLYFYDIVEKKGVEYATVALRQVIDMRDPNFSVCGVSDKDVIHANKNDVPNIFRVSTTLLSNVPDSAPNSRHHSLLLADTAEERKKWVYALNELRQLYKKCKLADKRAFDIKEVFDASTLHVNQIRAVKCAAIIDHSRVVLGFTEGLYCAELDNQSLVPVGGERENHKRCIEMVMYNASEQLLIVLVNQSKEKHVRIVPSAALDGRDLKWIKIPETKGCHLVAMGKGEDQKNFIVAAVKKTVTVFLIDRKEKRHHKLRELAMPGFPQCLAIENGKIAVGFPTGFRTWSLNSQLETQVARQSSLVNMEDQSLRFLFDASARPQDSYEAQMLIDLSERTAEYLLVFNKLGVYVDGQGRRSRSLELHFPSYPRISNGFAYLKPYLSVYCDSDVHIFDAIVGEWIQTVNIRSAFPLTSNGLLSYGLINDAAHIVLFHDILAAEDEIVTPRSLPIYASGKRDITKKFTVRNPSKDDSKPGDRLSKPPLPISGPSDFIHIVHMGPGSVELKNMIDLPSANSGTKLGGILRSTSSNSSSSAPMKPLGGTKQDISNSQKNRQSRPQSTTSKGSDGSSSLGRDGTLNSSVGSDNPYLEPTSKMSLTPSSAASPK